MSPVPNGNCPGFHTSRTILEQLHLNTPVAGVIAMGTTARLARNFQQIYLRINHSEKVLKTVKGGLLMDHAAFSDFRLEKQSDHHPLTLFIIPGFCRWRKKFHS
jgi:hypothetical protein